MEKSKKMPEWLIVLGISIVSVLAALMMANTTSFQTLELKSLDMRFGLRGPLSVEDNPIVILKIDDQSDESTPHRWPWPRSYFAHVLRNLNEAGVKAIGVDVIFDQPDKYGAREDDQLREVLKEYDNIVLAGKIARTFEQRSFSNMIFPPYEKFITQKSHWGLVSLESDLDGFYRRYIVGDVYNDSLYNSFAAKLYQIYTDQDSAMLSMDESSFHLGSLTIPKYDANSMLINFIGPAYSFPNYSFDNVLDTEDFDLLEDYDLDTFDDPGDPEFGISPGLKYSGLLKDKIVLIGSTMQELHDNFPTPFLDAAGNDSISAKVEMPGVEIHANALLTMLQNRFLRRVPDALTIGNILLALLITFFATRFLPTLWSAAAVLAGFAGFVVGAIYLFSGYNMIIEMVFPTLVVGFAYMGHILYHYLQTQQEKRMLRGAFAQYVPEKVVQDIVANPEKLQLGGEERVVSVMFSDVAGFTSISEKLTPAELVVLLNEYLTAMTNIVLDHNGIIDKYEGDAIMAEFGVPVPFDDHPQVACRVALRMQEKLVEMRKQWEKEGRPQLEARIGINTGEMIVGNMGSQTVFDYTVMGDHVNLASRLEGANKQYGTFIMISEFTNAYVKNDFYTRPLDLIRVKGKEQPIEVFELIAERGQTLDSTHLEMLSVYQRGIESYRKRSWNEAIEFFEYCLSLREDDTPSKLYRKRCLEFKLNDPGPEWDGVFTMTTK